uniref:Leucine-rich repeat-containing protein 59 n=1 Tax=Globodera rostochiensis TaxID=31243 RepID=A0A914GXS6_GLORO
MSHSRAPELTVEMLKKRVSDGRMDLSSLRLNKIPLELMCRSLEGQRITRVDLSNNLLTSFSTQFSQFFPDIQEINLHSNKLKRLPENFGLLSNLRWLDLSNNQIKKLPVSFAELDQLEVVGDCSNDKKRSLAARNAVQYVQFFSTLSSESTAIADEAFLQNESSSNTSNGSANPNASADLRQAEKRHRNWRLRLQQDDEVTHQLDGEIPNIRQASSRVCSFVIRFVFFLTFIILVGVPIWLTLDSIREVCVSSQAVLDRTLPHKRPEERLCAKLAQSLMKGILPTPDHWSHVVDERLMASIPQQMQHFRW